MKVHLKKYQAEYHSWVTMKRRCLNINYMNYKYYGGRGISIDKDWLEYDNFLQDMGKKPFPEATLERIDNNKDYSKDNCKWASYKEQTRNRSTNKLLTFRNKTQCLAAWADELHLPLKTISQRLRRGWSLEDALLRSRRWTSLCKEI